MLRRATCLSHVRVPLGSLALPVDRNIPKAPEQDTGLYAKAFTLSRMDDAVASKGRKGPAGWVAACGVLDRGVLVLVGLGAFCFIESKATVQNVLYSPPQTRSFSRVYLLIAALVEKDHHPLRPSFSIHKHHSPNYHTHTQPPPKLHPYYHSTTTTTRPLPPSTHKQPRIDPPTHPPLSNTHHNTQPSPPTTCPSLSCLNLQRAGSALQWLASIAVTGEFACYLLSNRSEPS